MVGRIEVVLAVVKDEEIADVEVVVDEDVVDRALVRRFDTVFHDAVACERVGRADERRFRDFRRIAHEFFRMGDDFVFRQDVEVACENDWPLRGDFLHLLENEFDAVDLGELGAVVQMRVEVGEINTGLLVGERRPCADTRAGGVP